MSHISHASMNAAQLAYDRAMPDGADDFRDLSEDAQYERINAALSKALGVKNTQFNNASDSIFDLLSQVREYMAFDTTSAEKPLRLAAIGLALVVAIRDDMEQVEACNV